MTPLGSAVPAAAGPVFAGPRLAVSTLAEFPGSVPLGVAFHVGFAVVILWLAVRWARDAVSGSGEPRGAPRPPGADGRTP